MGADDLPQLSLVRVNKVWDRGRHNAFTDLCFARGRFWMVFREAGNHVSDDGVIIVLSSALGDVWQLETEIGLEQVDLRDPKITLTPDNQLLITCAGKLYGAEGHPHQSFLIFSANGRDWSDPKPTGRLHDWIWRTRFIYGKGFGVAYHPAQESTTLYTLNHDDFDIWVDPLLGRDSHGVGYPNEHDLFPLGSGQMGCLLRRDADTGSAKLGIAQAPYRDWQWQDLGQRIGGPVVLPLDYSETRAPALLCAVRLYEPVRTALCWLHTDTPSLQECLILPSAGDTSYAGLVQQGHRILCSYYSSHEEKTSIYLAELEWT